MKAAWLLSVVLFSLSACADSYLGPEGASLNREFSLRVGTKVVIASEDLTISFGTVLQDSRCPLGVVCVWPGNGTVLLQLSKPGFAQASAELNTTLDPRETTYVQYAIVLKVLDPYPQEGVTIDPASYIAKILVYKVVR